MAAVRHTPPITSEVERRLYRRITRRLIPFLFLCYILAYIDRVNVGFAKLQMQQDLGMTEAAYGLGAGIFFIGYFLFENPRSFYLVRFLLGVVESGFFPGVILYLTFWYPERHRARMVATFMSAIP